MGAPPGLGRPPSLLGVTIRRATVLGRFFLGYGTVLSVLMGVSLAVSSGSAFPSAFPFLLPVFGSVGSMGALTVFTSDRIKGALEYMLAYGIPARRIFAEVLAACLVLVTIIVCVAVGAGVGAYLARGHAPSLALAQGLGLYAIPMTYASAAFATTVGMYWTALSSPSMGMSSPIGVAPLIGILPPVIVLLSITALAASGGVSSPDAAWRIGVLAMVTVTAVTVGLLASIGHLLRQERLLSPS